jgi:hypothetical protein
MAERKKALKYMHCVLKDELFGIEVVLPKVLRQNETKVRVWLWLYYSPLKIFTSDI